jgi:hypothetical protein
MLCNLEFDFRVKKPRPASDVVYKLMFLEIELDCCCLSGFFLLFLLFILWTFISHGSLFFLLQWNRNAIKGEVILIHKLA